MTPRLPRRLGLLLPGLLASSVALAQQQAAKPPILGFLGDHGTAQRQLEASFDASLDARELDAWLKQLSSEPNHVGSPHNKANAEWVLRQFKDWGWDAHIETFWAAIPQPLEVQLQLLGPHPYIARLHEPAIPEDPNSSQHADALAPYIAYGADGDVSGSLVYVNYGLQDDYKELARRGIDVKGKIVIARYGSGWRGLKPQLAQDHGAIGTIIYSDPADDGYARGDVYPRGGYRPEDAVQRGTGAIFAYYPGDPQTPGYASTKGARRIPFEQASPQLKIPVIPISYADATPLLKALDGPVVPASWRGALPITYHMGDSDAQVHLRVKSDWSLKPVYDVIATLRGSDYPDEWVVRGNHRDGWVFGAADPLSGQVALLAEAKAIGALAKTGWKPRRTLVYASWDSEEVDLIGSTEWVEAHADELSRKAVLYLNSDGNSRGFLRAGGSHSLQHFVNQLTADVTDPETQASMAQRHRAKLLVDASAANAKPADKRTAGRLRKGDDFPIDALGSGSDFAAFTQHIGLPTLALSYGGEGEGGVYHSLYDSYTHYTRFADPGLVYGVTLAQTNGHGVLRFANADVLPHRYGDLADTLQDYVDDLRQLLETQRKQAATRSELLDDHSLALVADPRQPLALPERIVPAPELDFTPLQQAVNQLKQSAKAYDDALAARKTPLPNAQAARLNKALQPIEQTALYRPGLPNGRDWYKHLFYANGLYTGYGVKTLPGVTEAVESERWDEARRYIGYTAERIRAYAQAIDKATKLLALAS